MAEWLFVATNVTTPDTAPFEWPDEALIAFVDAFDEDMRGTPLDAVLPLNKCVWTYFEAWIVLDERTS